MNTSITSVQTTIVSSDDNTHTYEVKKVLLDEAGNPAGGKDAILIGLYPTTTAEEPYKTDLSTNHLVCKMQELGLRSVRILNLFSQVCESEKLSARGLEVDEENLSYIESVLKESEAADSLCIIAWGTSMATCKAAAESKARIVRLFDTYHPEGNLYQLSAPSLALDSSECVHVLYLGIRHKREGWRLREYRFPEKKLPVEPPAKKGRKKALKAVTSGSSKETSTGASKEEQTGADAPEKEGEEQ